MNKPSIDGPLSNPKSRRKNGQGMVEFALVMPILLLAIYGLFEVGRMVFIYSNVVSASREAVRYGSATGTVNGFEQYKDCPGIRRAAHRVDFLGSISDTGISIEYYNAAGSLLYSIAGAACPAASSLPNVPTGGLIKVTVSGSFSPLAAIVRLTPKTFTSWGERTILGQINTSGISAPPPPPPSTGPQAPIITKSFLPTTIVLGEKATLIIYISNPNDSTTLNNISFSDTYPGGLNNVNPLVTSNNCGGTLAASAGGNSIGLSGASLPPYSQCSLTSVVTSGAVGVYPNTTGTIRSNENAAGNVGAATLTVTQPGFICNNNTIVHGSLFFNVNMMETMTLNNNTGQNLTIANIDVVWNSDKGHHGGSDKTLKLTGITVASQSAVFSPGKSGPEYVFSNSPSWILPPGRSTFQFTFDKSYDNQDGTELVIMNFSNPGCEAFTFRSDVNSPPVIEKFFSPPTINANGTSLLTFIITNPNNAVIGLTGINFVDNFPAGMTRSIVPASLQCQGTVTTTSTRITLTGGVIPAETSCTVQIIVTAIAGIYNNTTGSVTSTNAGTGNTASATLTAAVLPPTLNWKRFSPSTIQIGGTSTLSIKLTNPNTTTALTGLSFTDTFPGGVTLASAPSASQCGGTITSTSDSLTLTNGTLNGLATCTIYASVTSSASGSYVNTLASVNSTEAGLSTSAPASATLNVGAIQPPSLSKSFNPTNVQQTAPSTLTFTINNPNSQTVLSGIAFSDTYPVGLLNVAPLVTTNTCGGTLTAAGGGDTISLSGGSIPAANSCTVSIQVSSLTVGTYANTSGTVSSSNGGNGNNASATLTVSAIMPPVISKSFAPANIQFGQTSNLTFTITNPNTITTINGLAFTDTFPAGMTLASTPPTPQCGGTVTSTSGSMALSGGTLAPSSQCTVTVTVTATTIKTYNNTSSAVSSGNAGTGNSASANLTVSAVQAPAFNGMSFNPSQILTGTTSTLSITINNPNSSTTLTGIAFTDTYPADMTNASPLLVNNTCGGTLAASGGGGTLGLSGVTLAAGSSCTLSIQITIATAGNFTNATGSVSSTNGGTGNTTSASILVTAAPCNSSTVTHTSITYLSSTTMQMTISNNTGKQLNLNQVRVWWNYAYGHYTNGGHPREPISVSQVKLGLGILPGGSATSPLTISASGNLLPMGDSVLLVTFNTSYDNHEYDAFTMTFQNGECSGFTLSAP